MISFRVISASTVASLLFASAASAVTVANRDDRDHKVTVIEGDAQEDHIVKPDAVLEGVCQKGCLIRLDDSNEDPYELEGSEVTSIEAGELYDDELEVPAEPNAGDAGRPSRPGLQP